MKSLVLAALCSLAAAPAPKTPQKVFERSRSGDHATAQLYATGFDSLSKNDQLIAWHLSMAAHAGEPIALDQAGWNNVAIQRVLETIYLFGLERDPAQPKPGSFDAKFTDYLLRFYGHGGNHDANTSVKFVPAFGFEDLLAAAKRAWAQKADFGVKDEAALTALITELRPAIFDPSYEPTMTAKSPPPGKDLLTASSNTMYGKDVTLKEVEAFKEQNPLNSRVVKQDGKLVEQVYRAGTPDGRIKPGLYAAELQRVITHLKEAQKLAKGGQKTALGKLIRYFQTGDLRDWDAYDIAWLREDPQVDANLGFIETYVDARGQKGFWEALVNYKDKNENRVMEGLSKYAQYFEDRMPWPDAYKRKNIHPPVAKAIAFLDAYPQPPAGINLPNEQHIREKYGSKSVLVMNTIEAAQAMKRTPLDVEFSLSPEDKEAARTLGPSARKLMVAFHEVTGHASGKSDPKLKGDPSEYLKEYDNTLEEARADLVALWHAFDPKLAKMGFPNYRAIGEQMYRSFVIECLTNVRLVESGDSFEEDHQRGGWMTLNYLIDKGAVELVRAGGKDGSEGQTYVRVKSYDAMHTAVGELLTKLMVIKATGDYAGIQKLVQEKGIHFDPKLRDEVVQRVGRIQVPKIILMISPQLVPTVDAKGRITRVSVHHDQSFIDQHLLRSLLGELAPSEAAKVAAKVGTDHAALITELRSRRSR